MRVCSSVAQQVILFGALLGCHLHRRSPSSGWRSAPAPAAPLCPHEGALGVAAAGARRRRCAASAEPARTRTTPQCGWQLGVRPIGGARPIGRRGGLCAPVAAVRWGEELRTLLRRRPAGQPPQAAPTRAHTQRPLGAPAGGAEDRRQRRSRSRVPQPSPDATPSGRGGEANGSAAMGGPTAPHRWRLWRRPPAGLHHGRCALPPTPRRRGRSAAGDLASALMRTPSDAAVTAVAAMAAERDCWGATSAGRRRAIPRAELRSRPQCDRRWWLPCRRRRRARVPPLRRTRPLRPPRPPRPSKRRPRPRPLPAAACGCASHAWLSSAHRRVGGRRGGNAASNAGRLFHPARVGVPRVVRRTLLCGAEKNGQVAWPAAHGRSAHGHRHKAGISQRTAASFCILFCVVLRTQGRSFAFTFWFICSFRSGLRWTVFKPMKGYWDARVHDLRGGECWQRELTDWSFVSDKPAPVSFSTTPGLTHSIADPRIFSWGTETETDREYC